MNALIRSITKPTFLNTSSKAWSSSTRKYITSSFHPTRFSSSVTSRITSTASNSYNLSFKASFTTEADYLAVEELPNELSSFELFRARAVQTGRVTKKYFEKQLEFIHVCDDSKQLLFLLSCCADFLPTALGNEKISFASIIWQKYAAQSFKFSLTEVTAFLKVYIAAGVPFNPDAWWVTPDIKKILNSHECLLLLLECAAECGNLSASADIIAKIRDLKYPIGETELSLSIIANGRAKNYQGVESVLETMKSTGIERGQMTYFALLLAAIDNGKPITEFLKGMEANNIGISELQHVKILHSLARANNTKLLSLIMRPFPVNNLSHEVQNLILQLIHEGKHFYACNICPLLLKDISSQDLSKILIFFPYELVRSNKSVEDILEVCLSLQSNFPDHNSFLHCAVEESLRDPSKRDLSIELLGHISPLRNHYFWPLIIRSTCLEEVVNIVKRMLSLGLKLDHDTLAFYIFPNLLTYETPIQIIKHLQSTCELTITKQLGPMLHTLVINRHLDEAVQLCKIIRTRTIDAKKILRPLSNALQDTKEFQLGANLLDLLVASRKFQEYDVVGLFLMDYCNRCNPQDLKELLSYLAKFRLRVSLASYEIISTKSTMKQIGLQHLDMLTDSAYGTATSYSAIPHPNDMNLEELEAHLIELKSKQMNTRGVLRKLLQVHCRNHNVERALQIKKELDAQKFEYSPGILSSLLSLYIQIQDESRATDTYRQIEEYPKFFLDEHKMIDFCKLKIQTGSSLDEVSKLLDSYTSHLSRNRRSPRNLDVRNSLELVEEIKKNLGEDSATVISTKLSDKGFL